MPVISRRRRLPGLLALLLAAAAGGCDGGSSCGPTSAVIAQVTDGDTVQLEGGEKVRYLGVDTPETYGQVDCYGPEAKAFNTDLVEGQRVDLEYDAECRDKYGRLLAYVTLNGQMVNRVLLERGYARVLIIPPNGKYAEDFEELEREARSAGVGLWGACY
jgi:micrococcal nuclease